MRYGTHTIAELAATLGRSPRAPVLVLLEKYSRLTFFHHIPDKKARTVMYGILFVLRTIPHHLLRSCTYDNGSEHVLHEQIDKRLSSRSYFCAPYRAWEKGQVEYSIRLFRAFFPKKTDFTTITSEQVTAVQHILNNRPRECLQFRTPLEVFSDFVTISP